ncbi:MAG: phosphatase [Synergistales bacterium]|nr:phosphatase [Synergistales bacterium]
MSRYGAIDLGSNSLRTLILSRKGETLSFVDGGLWTPRITEGLSERAYRIGDEALERTLDALREAVDHLDRKGVPRENRVFFATESLRSAENADAAEQRLAEAAGIPLQRLSGEDEARFGYRAVRIGLGDVETVFDLGGGSLELAGAEEAVSLPLGAVRLLGDCGEDLAAIRRTVDAALDASGFRPGGLAGVGGTSSTIAMMLAEIPWRDFDPARIHGAVIPLQGVEALIERMRRLTVEERRDVVGLHPRRADIILPGLVVVERLLSLAGETSFRHSESGLLWGMVMELVARQGRVVRQVRMRNEMEVNQ